MLLCIRVVGVHASFPLPASGQMRKSLIVDGSSMSVKRMRHPEAVILYEVSPIGRAPKLEKPAQGRLFIAEKP